MTGSTRRRSGRPAEWNGRVAAPWMLIGGGVLALAFLVLASLFSERAYVFLGLPTAAVALLAVGSMKVSVTGREVVMRSALVPPVRRRIALTKITEAFAKQAHPRELGGWGFRWRPRRSALSLRAGDALWLRLESGREFVITVDDAARAARAVNENLEGTGHGSVDRRDAASLNPRTTHGSSVGGGSAAGGSRRVRTAASPESPSRRGR